MVLQRLAGAADGVGQRLRRRFRDLEYTPAELKVAECPIQVRIIKQAPIRPAPNERILSRAFPSTSWRTHVPSRPSRMLLPQGPLTGGAR